MSEAGDTREDAERVEEALEVEKIDKDLYRSKRLWMPDGGRGVFGGQVIAQAAWAATLSVKEEGDEAQRPAKHLHSLHSYFLSFGDAGYPILYHVGRLRDGRSYSTRSVLATQRGQPIFSLNCSFQTPEPAQPTFRVPIPGVNGIAVEGKRLPQPEECLPTEDRLQKVLHDKPNLPRKLKEYIERRMKERRLSSIELRNVDKTELGWLVSMKKGAEAQAAYWFRSRAPVRTDSAFQKCVLAYVSDLNFIGTAAKANGLTATSRPTLGMLASLDHSMWFYDDSVDASEWLLFHMESPAVASGRGLAQGKIYKRDGTLAVVCTQEGVVRAAL